MSFLKSTGMHSVPRIFPLGASTMKFALHLVTEGCSTEPSMQFFFNQPLSAVSIHWNKAGIYLWFLIQTVRWILRKVGT